MKHNKRVIIIGLDGVPFQMLRDLSKKGIMPYTNEIISKGTFKQMFSSIPEISSVAWSSIITGKNPGEHGIFGFVDLYPNSYKIKFPNFTDLKAPPFWDLIPAKSIIINVPATYPVKKMNGVHISGFVSIDIEKSVYPEELIHKLKEFDYRLDVDSEKAHKSLDLFLEDLDKTLEAQIKSYRFLWDNYDWQIFMLVFTGTDRLMHFLLDAYENENNKYHRYFLTHFSKIDEIIGEINQHIDKKEDILIILSDHGFERLEKNIYINSLLEENGFLRFENNKKILENISPFTKAFALDPARIYINFKDKYPSGSVNIQDKEKILKDLESFFSSLIIDGKKVIKRIYRKEEIYKGPFMNKAADLILLANPGFNLKANKSMENGIFTGKHTYNNAFYLINKVLKEDYFTEEFNVTNALNIKDYFKCLE